MVFLMPLKFASTGRAILGGLALQVLVTLTLTSGCGQAAPPPVEGRLAIENVVWTEATAVATVIVTVFVGRPVVMTVVRSAETLPLGAGRSAAGATYLRDRST